jgi:DNA-binding transcriptional LysR family regulator
MNLRQLEALVRVADLRNFTQAAKELSVTQPAVSFQIRSLEDELGVRLLERQGKTVLLTAQGEVVYREAKEMLASQDRIHQALSALSSLESGVVTVGASSIPGEYVLPRLVGRFKTEYPGIRVVVRVGDTAQVLQWLLDKAVDLGVVGAQVEDDHLIFRAVLTDELVAIFPKGHPLGGSSSETSLSDLFRWGFVMREEGSGTRASLEGRVRQAGLDSADLRVVAEFSTTGAVVAAVAAGVGVSVVSRWAAEEAIRAGGVEFRPITGMDSTRQLYLVEHALRQPSRAAGALQGFLLALGSAVRKEV